MLKRAHHTHIMLTLSELEFLELRNFQNLNLSVDFLNITFTMEKMLCDNVTTRIAETLCCGYYCIFFDLPTGRQVITYAHIMLTSATVTTA